MTAASGAAPDVRRLLETLLAAGRPPSTAERQTLTRAPEPVLDAGLADLVRGHGAAAWPLLAALDEGPTSRGLRRAIRRARYRLEQRGLMPPSAPERPPSPGRAAPPVRAWLSGVDGSGSRAVWVLFEGAYGALQLCSLILNDQAGILEAAGGAVTRKRLEHELRELRASQKLPWVEVDPGRAAGLVAEALALHRTLGMAPPPAFERWRPLFAEVAPAGPPALPEPDPALVERGAELLQRPELAGWFLDPERVQADALERLQARESPLVLPEPVKAEREAALVDRVLARDMDDAARALWGRRLAEMALVFRSAGRAGDADLAAACAAALLAPAAEPRYQPFARALAVRALDVAAEVALGRLSADEVSRRPRAAAG
jgi:hypothetical protein